MPVLRYARDRQRSHSPGRFLLVLISSLFLCGILILQVPQQSVKAARGEVQLPGTITPLLIHSRLIGQADPRQRITLALGLRPRNESSFEHTLQQVTDPTNAFFHHYLTSQEYIRDFRPDEGSYLALEQFLRRQGLQIVQSYPHHLLLSVSGTIAQVEQAFSVQLHLYAGPLGKHYYANNSDPLLPTQFISIVQSIIGLNDATSWQHTPVYKKYIQQGKQATQSTTCPKQSNGYYTPAQLATAYNVRPFYAAHDYGEGQSMALFELSNFSLNDIHAYTHCFGQSRTPIHTIATSKQPTALDPSTLEVEMDAEMVLSMAPHLSALNIYLGSNDAAGYLAQWARIVQDVVPVVSTSWGACERTMDAQVIQQENTLLKLATLQGQTIFASSGDTGSEGCFYDQTPTPKALSAEDPATQPYVTAVGGSILTLRKDGSYGHEVVWNDLPNTQSGYGGGASGGGASQYWKAPSWQQAPGVYGYTSLGKVCHAAPGGRCRLVPDISLQADPYRGYMVYCTIIVAGCDVKQPWMVTGGTSAATPVWAAFQTLFNVLALRNGGFNLGFLNPLLYAVAHNPHHYASDFHDIVSGNNDFNHLNQGNYPAKAGYDLATGLGSGNIYALARDLIALAHKTRGLRSIPSNTNWYFATGNVGGGTGEALTLVNPHTLPAHVTVSYVFVSRHALTRYYILTGGKRLSLNVNAALSIPASKALLPVSIVVRSTNNIGLLAECSMTTLFRGVLSRVELAGENNASRLFYFPHITSQQTSSSKQQSTLAILNPDSQHSSHVVITYHNGLCALTKAPCPTQKTTIPPLEQRIIATYSAKGYQLSTVEVQSSTPIVSERSLHFQRTIPDVSGQTTGSTIMAGATAGAQRWLFAEGYTGKNYHEELILANFTRKTTKANATLIYSNGQQQTLSLALPALGRTVLDVNAANLHPSGSCGGPCRPTADTAIEVIAPVPVVAERLVYFHNGGTETLGQVAVHPEKVHTFTDSMPLTATQQYLSLLNATQHAEVVVLTFSSNGFAVQKKLIVSAHSRRTFDINAQIGPILQTNPVTNNQAQLDILSVQALNADSELAAERVSYTHIKGEQGGSAILGLAG